MYSVVHRSVCSQIRCGRWPRSGDDAFCTLLILRPSRRRHCATTVPSVGTRIFTAAPSWRPPGGSTGSLGAISVNSINNPQKYRALGDMLAAHAK